MCFKWQALAFVVSSLWVLLQSQIELFLCLRCTQTKVISKCNWTFELLTWLTVIYKKLPSSLIIVLQYFYVQCDLCKKCTNHLCIFPWLDFGKRICEESWRHGGNNRFLVLMVASMKSITFWDIAQCSLGVDRRFRGVDFLYHQGDHRHDDGGSTHLWNIGLPETTLCYSPEDFTLHWVKSFYSTWRNIYLIRQ
jgi:hypothetical protein